MKGKWFVAGALILAEIGLCGAMLAAFWASFSFMEIGRFRFDGFVNDTVSATATEKQQFTVDGPATVNVNHTDGVAAFGDITVIGGAGDEIVVTANKTAWASSTEAAQADLELLKVVVSQAGDVIEVRVERPQEGATIGNSRPDTVDFTITVPVETATYLVTDFGDVSVSGTQGNVTVDTDFGSATVTRVDGGAINIRSGFGEMHLEDVTADDIEVRSNSGEIDLNEVEATGAVTLDSDFGTIRFVGGEGRSLNVDTNSGTVRLENLSIKESVVVSSDFGTVNLAQVTADSYDVQTNSGGITLDGAQGLVMLHTDFGDLTVTQAADVTVDLSTNSGSIDFSGSLGKGPHNVKTDFGAITLNLPAEVELNIDLKTDFGRIRSDFPITLDGGQEDDRWVGTLSGGGPQLTAQTNSGDITLTTLTP